MDANAGGSRHDFLDFAANVWNAGPGLLVVEGFRRPGQHLMDAYQFFRRGTHRLGYAPTGTLAYDNRPSHEHWHFTDFARYDLLDAHNRQVVPSDKTGFASHRPTPSICS